MIWTNEIIINRTLLMFSPKIPVSAAIIFQVFPSLRADERKEWIFLNFITSITVTIFILNFFIDMIFCNLMKCSAPLPTITATCGSPQLLFAPVPYLTTLTVLLAQHLSATRWSGQWSIPDNQTWKNLQGTVKILLFWGHF